MARKNEADPTALAEEVDRLRRAVAALSGIEEPRDMKADEGQIRLFLYAFSMKQHAYIQGLVHGLSPQEFADLVGLAPETTRSWGRGVVLRLHETKRKRQIELLQATFDAVDPALYKQEVGIAKDWAIRPTKVDTAKVLAG